MRFLTAVILAALGLHALHRPPPIAAQSGERVPCSISGAKYPELIPEYIVWQEYFHQLATSASGKPEGLTPPPGKKFVPGVVANTAMYIGISESEMLTFLDVADTAARKVEEIRRASDAGRITPEQSRRDQVEVLLDARDDVIRKLSPTAMRALRRHSPAKGTVFDLPRD